jgi:hypothetical protein
MAKIIAWPLKRVALARLTAYADGSEVPPAGAEPLVSTNLRRVEIAHTLPAEPDRICVYGMPVRATFAEVTAEDPGTFRDTSQFELRVRVFEPGEDAIAVDQTLGDMCDAVVTALLDTPLTGLGRTYLAAMAQDLPELKGHPDPSITWVASLVFRTEVIGYAG